MYSFPRKTSFLQDQKIFKILPKYLGMGVEDRTEDLKIGVVEEENEFLSGLGKVGDEVMISLWREVHEQVNNYFLSFCLSVSLSLYLSVFLSLHLSIFAVSLFFCFSVALSFCPSIFQSLIFLSFSPFPAIVYLIRVSSLLLYLGVFLPVCLFVSMSHSF
jgi:hypothetical protein